MSPLLKQNSNNWLINSRWLLPKNPNAPALAASRYRRICHASNSVMNSDSCQCDQCGRDLIKIREDVTEQLDVVPARSLPCIVTSAPNTLVKTAKPSRRRLACWSGYSLVNTLSGFALKFEHYTLFIFRKFDCGKYNSGNSRNGYNRKTLKGDHGAIEIETPRDRNGSFEPVFVAKNQTRLTKFDDQILS